MDSNIQDIIEDEEGRLDDVHHAMERYYMPKLASVEQILYQLDPTRQKLPVDRIKQHAQLLYGKKKPFKLATPLGIMCPIEAMEECIARKRHELMTRQPSATLTKNASPFFLPKARAESCLLRKRGRLHYQCPLITKYQ